jgi:hypothetical protein
MRNEGYVFNINDVAEVAVLVLSLPVPAFQR